MTKYSIQNELSKQNKSLKSYLFTYDLEGFELGFGKKGRYSGHSHIFFTDVIFSFEPILTSNYRGERISSNLVITPSQSYMGDVQIEDFFFIKFCDKPENVIFPEKVEEVLGSGNPIAGEVNIDYLFVWYPTKDVKEKIKMSYTNSLFSLELGGQKYEIFK